MVGRYHVKVERVVTLCGITFTMLCWLLFIRDAATWLAGESFPSVFGTLVLIGVISSFVYGSLVYHVTRLGFLGRIGATNEHVSAIEPDWPALTLLLPSFKEEERSIRQSMLSCGLLDYPRKTVVLLIDDLPDPTSEDDRRLLETSRSVPRNLQCDFDEIIEALSIKRAAAVANESSSARLLMEAYRLASSSVYRLDCIQPSRPADHTDRCFLVEVVLPIAERFAGRADELELLANSGASPAAENTLREFDDLIARFDVQFKSFERKLYLNLSHEPNKAMNINSYLGLMGRSLSERRTDEGVLLIDADERNSSLSVPHTKYVATLDADSFLKESYARVLVGYMEQPGNERVAVAQTPYSAVPGSPIALECAAGATTDIQYLIHQGFTGSNATYWVGANAILRREALDDIVELISERGFDLPRFIQDRTVIEDTESTIDLVAKKWSLYNFPARLSFSATPADGGSLLIQRRRWSNGGLLIFPKLARYYVTGLLDHRVRPTEMLLRIHYLISPTLSNVGMLLLFFAPLGDSKLSVWIPLSAASYFYLYAADLSKNGYTRRHVLGVYALNLVLMPINLGGIVKSLYQGVTRTKTPFGRTPKIGTRTAMPAFYVFWEVVILLLLAVAGVLDLLAGRLLHFGFSLVNVCFLSYGLIVFLGVRDSLSDLTAPLRCRPRTQSRRPGKAPSRHQAAIDKSLKLHLACGTSTSQCDSHVNRFGSNGDCEGIEYPVLRWGVRFSRPPPLIPDAV